MSRESKKGKRFADSEKKAGIAKKKVFIVIIILLIIAGIGIIIFKMQSNKTVNEEERKEISQELLQDKEFAGRPVKNISLDIKENASYLKCDIENNQEKIDKQDISIVFVKEDNSEFARFSYQLEEIPANEIGNIKLVTTTNLIDAYNFYFESNIDEKND